MTLPLISTAEFVVQYAMPFFFIWPRLNVTDMKDEWDLPLISGRDLKEKDQSSLLASYIELPYRTHTMFGGYLVFYQ